MLVVSALRRHLFSTLALDSRHFSRFLTFLSTLDGYSRLTKAIIEFFCRPSSFISTLVAFPRLSRVFSRVNHDPRHLFRLATPSLDSRKSFSRFTLDPRDRPRPFRYTQDQTLIKPTNQCVRLAARSQ